MEDQIGSRRGPHKVRSGHRKHARTFQYKGVNANKCPHGAGRAKRPAAKWGTRRPPRDQQQQERIGNVGREGVAALRATFTVDGGRVEPASSQILLQPNL